uniref:Amiloride-sensitive sodium channel n=1 Tax=Macrostomum lignano TaxID=282301 RepID=A0A1I8HS76_9PLAT
MGLRQDFELFCTATSLRGVAKTVKAPTRPLRCIWTAYVAAMAAFLVTCVCFIVTDYLSYKTVIQTTVVLNDPGLSWPAVTVCGHYPFTESGRQLWQSGQILSPTNFSRMLRAHALKMFDAGNHIGAEEILASDSKRVYYQNLEPDDAEKLSHTAQQLFIFCINATGSFMEMSSGDGCAMQLKLISLPDYFNCFQVQATPTIDSLTVVLRVTDSHHQHGADPHEQAFVQDAFQQASGFRVQLQEHDRFPEPTDRGIHVAPGKMVEMAYQPVRLIEVGSPTDACLPETIASSRRVLDLGRDFAYSQEGCLRQELGRIVLKACGCHFADLLRETPPNATHPYCGDYRRGVEPVLRSRACLQSLNLPSLRANLGDTHCLKPCHYHDFEMVSSKTIWRAADWQLHWLALQAKSFRDLAEASERLADLTASSEQRRQAEASIQSAKNSLRDFLTAKNLTAISGPQVLEPSGRDFAYITVRRQTRNTIQKTETLSLSFSALMSQVGGLSSLTLGLTCAFAVELLELCLLKRHRKKVSKASEGCAEVADNSLVPQQLQQQRGMI